MHNPILQLFLKNYFAPILMISITALCVFSVGAYCIIRRFFFHASQNTTLFAIAGGDLMSTQLDLARAYIEINQKQLALEILNEVSLQGSASQKQEAKQLLHSVLPAKLASSK